MGRLSEECEYFAYGLSSSGSDWVTINFMKGDDLTILPDVLERVKFSCLAWTHEAKGIFYNCYPRQEGKTDGEEHKTLQAEQHLFQVKSRLNPSFFSSLKAQRLHATSIRSCTTTSSAPNSQKTFWLQSSPNIPSGTVQSP